MAKWCASSMRARPAPGRQHELVETEIHDRQQQQGDDQPPLVFISTQQEIWGWMGLIVKTTGDANAQAAPIRAILSKLDVDLPLFEAGTLTAALDRQLASLATARAAASGLLRAAEEQARAQRVTLAAVATLDQALADLRAAMPEATPEERKRFAPTITGDDTKLIRAALIAEGVKNGKVNSIIVPLDFKGIVNVK